MAKHLHHEITHARMGGLPAREDVRSGAGGACATPKSARLNCLKNPNILTLLYKDSKKLTPHKMNPMK